MNAIKYDFLSPLKVLLVAAVITSVSPAKGQDDDIADVFGDDSDEAQEPEPEEAEAVEQEDEPEQENEAEVGLKQRIRFNHGSDGVDLGLHISGGAHQCLRSGTGYVACKGADGGWDISWGIAGGFLVRPHKYFSVGVDAAYMNMNSRWNEGNLFWADFSVGPVARLHVPFNIMKLSVEPNIGIQAGYVQGNLRLSDQGVQRHDKHLGFILAAMAGIDFFIIPEFGFGIEARAYRTFYQEVCIEGPYGVICRGESNEEATWCVEQDCYGDEVAEYPWKIFYGGHLLYYF